MWVAYFVDSAVPVAFFNGNRFQPGGNKKSVMRQGLSSAVPVFPLLPLISVGAGRHSPFAVNPRSRAVGRSSLHDRQRRGRAVTFAVTVLPPKVKS